MCIDIGERVIKVRLNAIYIANDIGLMSVKCNVKSRNPFSPTAMSTIYFLNITSTKANYIIFSDQEIFIIIITKSNDKTNIMRVHGEPHIL